MKFVAQDVATLERLLTWRRDVRQFRPDPIAEAVVDALRVTMEFAPSVGNARPWRVIRAESIDLRQAVRKHFLRCNAAAAENYVGDQRDAYLRLVLAGLDTAPVQLAVFTETDPAEGHGLGRRTMPETLEQSTAMAIHTLWLAARAHNIGLGIVSILEASQIEQLCAVPRTWRFSAWLCLGYSKDEDDLPLLHRVDWQANKHRAWERR